MSVYFEPHCAEYPNIRISENPHCPVQMRRGLGRRTKKIALGRLGACLRPTPPPPTLGRLPQGGVDPIIRGKMEEKSIDMKQGHVKKQPTHWQIGSGDTPHGGPSLEKKPDRWQIIGALKRVQEKYRYRSFWWSSISEKENCLLLRKQSTIWMCARKYRDCVRKIRETYALQKKNQFANQTSQPPCKNPLDLPKKMRHLGHPVSVSISNMWAIVSVARKRCGGIDLWLAIKCCLSCCLST